MIDVFYTFAEDITPSLRKQALELLPLTIQEEILKFIHEEDQDRAILGKLLLLRGMQNIIGGKPILDKIETGEYERPYIPGFPDFNITHSHRMIACAISHSGKTGIDVEYIRKVGFEYLQRYMQALEWEDILGAKDPLQRFFTYWSKKESLIKADGRGFYFPLDKIHLEKDYGEIEGQRWYLTDLQLDEGYSTWLASASSQPEIIRRFISLKNLL